MMLWQRFFRKFAKTTQNTTKFTTWRRFIWATFALTKLFNLFAASSICANPISKCRKKFRSRRMTRPKFFATFGDGAKILPRSLCLGALPLLYPAAPPSVFALANTRLPPSRLSASTWWELSANRRMTRPKFFATFGDGAKILPRSLCLGALPLLYLRI